MRDTVIIIATAIVFGVLLYGGRLQDQMRRKGYRPGDSFFSVTAAIRSLATLEALKFAILVLALTSFAAVLIAFDRVGFFH